MDNKITLEEIRNNMLNAISDTYEKTVGYPTYDIIAAIAVALMEQIEELLYQAGKIDADNLSGEELEKFVKQRRGILVKEATPAKTQLTVKGNGSIKIGDLFSTSNNILFRSIEDKEIIGEGLINIEAVVPGSAGMVGARSIIEIPKTIQGINECINLNPTEDGFDKETDEALRERYYEDLLKPIATGNEWMFIKLAKAIPGVGDTKAEAMWNGVYTMKLYIIDSNKEPADEPLIERVQEELDPLEYQGQGKGELPSGCFTTIVAAESLEINVSVKIKLISGFELESTKTRIIENIKAYIREIAFKQNYISYAKIANAINDTEGVLDYENLLVNDGIANIQLSEYQVGKLNEVSVVE